MAEALLSFLIPACVSVRGDLGGVKGSSLYDVTATKYERLILVLPSVADCGFSGQVLSLSEVHVHKEKCPPPITVQPR